MRVCKKMLALLLIALILMGNFTCLASAEAAKINVAGSNMTLGNELKMNHLVKTSDLGSGTYTAQITHNGEVTEEIFTKYNSTYSYVSYTVAAAQMADAITVEVFDESGEAVSNVYETSVRTYAMNILGKSATDDKTKALLVDMLNYGAAAQQNFNYNTSDPANATLTDEQKALATGSVTCTDGRVKGENYYGSSLSLEEKILLNVYFKNVTSSMYAEVTFTDFDGEAKTIDVPFEEFKKLSGSTYAVVVDDIVLAESFNLVTVTIYNADGTVHGTATDSVESYIARNAASDLNDTIMRFAASAYNYYQPEDTTEPEEPEEPETPDEPEEPELPADGTICGVLTCTETGDPLMNAQVKVFNADNELVDTVNTIADGSFTIAVEAGTYTLKISADGFDLCEVQCTVGDSEETDVSTSLEPLPEGTLEGVITDEVTGDLLPGVVLEIYNADGRWVTDVTSNDKGVFRTSLAPGTYTLKTSLDTGTFPYETSCTVVSNKTTITDMSLTSGLWQESIDCFGRPGIQWYYFYDRKMTLASFEPYEPDFSSYNTTADGSFASLDESWPNHQFDPNTQNLVEFLYGYHNADYDYVLTVNGETETYNDLQDLVDDINYGKGVLVEAYICKDTIFVVVINSFIGRVTAVNLAKETVSIGGYENTITIHNDWGFDASDVDETVVLFRICDTGVHDVEVIEPVTATVTSAWTDDKGNHYFLADDKTYEYAETFGLYLGGVMMDEDHNIYNSGGRKHKIYTDKYGYVMWTVWADTSNTEIVVIDGDSCVSTGRVITADGADYKINTADFVYFEEGAPIKTVDTTYDFNAGQVGVHGTDDDILAWAEYVDDDEIYMARSNVATKSTDTIYLKKGAVKIGSDNSSNDVRDYLVNDNTQIIVRVPDYFGEEEDDFTYLYFDGINDIDANYMASDFQYFLDNECDQDGEGRYYAYIYVDAVYAMEANRAFVLRAAGSKTMQLTNGKVMSGDKYDAIINGEKAIVVYEENYSNKVVVQQLYRTGEEIPVVIKSNLALVGWTLDNLPVWANVRPDDEVLTVSENSDFLIDGNVLSWNQGTETVIEWEGLRMASDAAIWVAEPAYSGRYDAKLVTADEFNQYGQQTLPGYIWVIDALDETGRTDGRYDYLYVVSETADVAESTPETDSDSDNTEIVLIDADSWECSDDENICDFVYFEEGAPIKTVDTSYDFNAGQIGVHGTDEDILAWVNYVDDEIYMARGSAASKSTDTIYLAKGQVKIGSTNYSNDVRDYLVNDDTQIIVRVPDYTGSEEDAFTYLYFNGIDDIDANYVANDFQYFLDNECGQNGSGRFYSHIYIDATYKMESNRAFVLRSLGNKVVKLDSGRVMGGDMYEAIINGVKGVVVYRENYSNKVVMQQLNRTGEEIPVMIKSDLTLVGWTLDDMPVWAEIRPDDEVLTNASAPDFKIEGGVLSWNEGDETVVQWEGIRMAADCAIWIATPNQNGEFEAELVSQEEFNNYRANYGWELFSGYCWAVDALDDTGRTDGKYDYLLIVMTPAD